MIFSVQMVGMIMQSGTLARLGGFAKEHYSKWRPASLLLLLRIFYWRWPATCRRSWGCWWWNRGRGGTASANDSSRNLACCNYDLRQTDSHSTIMMHYLSSLLSLISLKLSVAFKLCNVLDYMVKSIDKSQSEEQNSTFANRVEKSGKLQSSRWLMTRL